MQQKPKYYSELVSRSYSLKKVFLKILQNLQKNTFAGAFFY